MSILIWLNEVIDLPHTLLGAQQTRLNWQEALLETGFLAFIALIVGSTLFQSIKKTSRIQNDQYKEKIFSEILLQESPSFFTAISPEGKTIMMNNSMLKKLGYTNAEVEGRDYLTSFIPEREQEMVSQIFFNLVEQNRPTKNENHILTKDGSQILVEWEGRPVLKDNGDLDFIYGAGVDITERKKIETALRDSEERYRSFVQNLQGIAYRNTLGNMPIFLHGAVEEITGYTEDDFLKGSPTWEQIINPQDRRISMEILPSIRTTPHYATELTYRIIRKDGKIRWIHEYIQNICDETGRVSEIQGMIYDITKTEEAEENLRKSDARYRILAENIQDVIWVLDKNLRYTYISPSVLRFRGYTVEEAMSLPLDKIFTPESHDRLISLAERYLSLEQSGAKIDTDRSITMELEQICKDGSVIWTEVTSSFVLDKNGRPDGFVGITRNITERKRAEESLKESEERYRTIFENTGTAMAILEENIILSLANSEFEKLSGFPRHEIEGRKRFTDFIDSKDTDRLLMYHGLRRKDPLSAPRNYEFHFVDKEGVTKDIFTTANMIPGSAKSVLSLLDITEMKKAQEDLMHSREQLRNLHKHAQDVREGERTRVAREIHDELGQVLTALKMDLSYLSRKFPQETKPLHTKINLMLKFIDMTIQSVKRITMDLRPGLLDHLGLVPAIEWQADEFQKRTGITCEVTVDPEDITLDKDQSTTVFRIFQETLTNVARHANASHIKTSLQADDGMLKMIVTDNGKGITRKQIEDSKSFGLMGIRERAYFSGGDVVFTGKKGHGTSVIVSIPIDSDGGSR
ncbi:MAG: PAS domain S-box protein [Deltaproteobacteria bacterium]|nr:PAS domain S-box protein [Deltaproteobacteria bacterium]